jgi:hypothetical protein
MSRDHSSGFRMPIPSETADRAVGAHAIRIQALIRIGCRPKRRRRQIEPHRSRDDPGGQRLTGNRQPAQVGQQSEQGL